MTIKKRLCQLHSRLKDKGVVSIWLLLMLVIMTSGFAVLYKSLLKVYQLNEALRSAENASRLVLSYYDADLYESYGLLAFENSDALYTKVKEVTETEQMPFKPQVPLLGLTPAQDQMIALGKTIIAGNLFEGLEEKLQPQNTGPPLLSAPQETFPEEAEEGKEPTERQKSIWRSLKRFNEGGKNTQVEGFTEEIPTHVFDQRQGFDKKKAKALPLTERYAVNAYLSEYFSSKFHPLDQSEKRPLKSSEIEYILSGSRTESQNGMALHMKIVASRLAMNLTAIVTSTERYYAASAMAATVIAVFPLSVFGAEAAVIGLWATIETEVEVQRLYRGELVPLVKTPAGTWYTDIDSILGYADDGSHVNIGKDIQKSKPGWINYDDQLQIFLALQDDATTLVRALQLMDMNLKIEDKALNWESLYTEIEIQVNDKQTVKKGYLHGY